MDDQLAALRERLAAVDRRILEAVAERQRLAAEVGEVKSRLGAPTRDFRRERRVVEDARRVARDLGLDPETAERLVLLLIRASLTRQERDRLSGRAAGSGRRALVIGGAGRMGAWMVRFLASQGFEVEVADPVGPVGDHAWGADWRDSGLDHDVIVVAATLRASAEILAELATRRPPGLVFDVGSLKGPLRPGLEALVATGCRVASLHPMFGPDTELLSGRRVVVCDVGDAAAVEAARSLFASTTAELVEMDVESHDRLIALVLGLSHAVNIAFFTALAEGGPEARTLSRIGSTSFAGQLAVARRIAGENPHLYFEIQALNDFGGEALARLSAAAEKLRRLVEEGDETAFVELMERGRRYLEATAADGGSGPAAPPSPGGAPGGG